MKKIFLGIFSVFMLMSGVFITACCDKPVSLSIDTENVTIYTNSQNQDNVLSKDVVVTVNNSSAGIGKIVESGGENTIHLSSTRRNSDNTYSFTIYGDKSGTARVRVWSIDDESQFRVINVTVNTVLEKIETTQYDSTQGRSNRFIVKGDGNEKRLKAEDYFDLKPLTANIKDVEWTFTNGQLDENGIPVVMENEVVVAKIENNSLWVSETAQMEKINLKASFTENKDVSNTVELDVLDNSTIYSLQIGDSTHTVSFYDENAVQDVKPKDATFELKRNDASRAVASGEIVINTKYNVQLSPIFYSSSSSGDVRLENYLDYFTFNVTSREVEAGKVTYRFEVNATDYYNNNTSGRFLLQINIGYADYDYDITTTAIKPYISTSYSVEGVNLFDSQQDLVNNDTIDIFSNYNAGGYTIRTILLPDDGVKLDNTFFNIKIDVGQSTPLLNYFNKLAANDKKISSIVKFTRRGEEVEFTNSNMVFTSTTLLQSGDVITMVASDKIQGSLENVVFEFVPQSDSTKKTQISLNLYSITSEENLEVVTDNDAAVETQYVASNVSGAQVDYTLKIKGLTSAAGLKLKNSQNPQFIFPEEDYFVKHPEAVTEIHVSDGENDPDYIVVSFSVRLSGINFDSAAQFWFEHITQKSSQQFNVEAFMPIDDVSILNADPLSTNVYYSRDLNQGFLLTGDALAPYENLTSMSLAKIVLEAGSILTLSTTFQSLANDVVYGFITLDQVIEKIEDEDTAKNIFEFAGDDAKIFDGRTALEYLAAQYGNLEGEIWKEGLNNYFSITTNRLILSDNEFKGFVFARFNGFSSDHREVVAVRIFALESFYAVKALASNVRDTLLYTTETLSQADISRASVNVTISFRNDGKTPTYTNDKEMFTFTSASGAWKDNSSAIKQNRFYTISNIDTPISGRYFTFTITANSTAHQTVIHDILTVTYKDDFGFERNIDIAIEIRNVNRVEKVEWINKTNSGDIYLNLTSSQESARKFMIKTAVMPSGPDGANDKTLRYRDVYLGDGAKLVVDAVETIDGGQNFNLSITATDKGGVGNLYILPNDMIKRVNSIDQVLIYKYIYGEDNQLVDEEIIYIPLGDFENYYDEIIAGSDNYSNYFLNNDNERIYYSDLILNIPIIMADGLEIETAVRVYSEEDLKRIDKALKYRVMNNITLNGWQAYDRIETTGAIFGDNESIVLNFTNDSQNFVDTLRGQIFDLVLTGDVTVTNGTYAGFIARENEGTISNVRVDVNYKDNKYAPSSLTYKVEGVEGNPIAGGLVGYNAGTITNSYTYGMNITATNSLYVGGLVGSNAGNLKNCGVEFYTFGKEVNEGDISYTYNKISVGASCFVGGLVGLVQSGSVIERDYIYAYPFTDIDDGNYKTLISGTENVYMFVAAGTGYTIKESFGFMGNLDSVAYGTTTFVDSYYVETVGGKKTMTFLSTGNAQIDNQQYDNNLLDRYKLILNHDIWEVDNIDDSVNFGMIYLKNNVQSAALDIENVKIKSFADKVLKVDDNNAILFYYQPQATISDPAERSELTNKNTVTLDQLFDIQSSEQKSLLISSVSQSLVVNATSVRITSLEGSVVKITAHSKMDLTKTKDFNVVITYALPKLTTLLGGYELNDGEVVRLQTSKSATDQKMSTIVHELDHTIYLNGNEYASVAQNSLYQIDYQPTQSDFIDFAKSELSLIMTGKKVTETPVSVQTFVELKTVAKGMDADTTAKYNNAIRGALTRNFKVSVFNGATNLLITNAKKLNFSPVDHATFDVDITTDNENDNLVFTLEIGGHTYQSDHLSNASSFDFVIDSTNNLHLSVIWTANTDKTKYSVSVFVPYAERYKVVQEYDFSLSVNALSQIDNEMYVNTVEMKLSPEYVNAVNVDVYSIQTRRSVNGTMYYAQSTNKANSIIPSSDAILVVHMTPEFALATHFTLTYAVEGSDQQGAAVQIMRLSENQNFGLYMNSAGTSTMGNGLRVNITDTDRQGKGYYYFRIYASNIFKTNATIVFTATFFNNDQTLYTATGKLDIDFMQDAQIKIDGQSVSSYLIAKSTTAKIEVTVGRTQTATLSLQNNGYGISLVLGEEREEGNFRIYSATLVVRVNAKVMENGQEQDTGVFYVRAGVSRIIDGVPDIKYTSIQMNLLDFTIDTQGISVSGSHNTTTYNQNTYDAFYVYRGASTTLNFDYPLVPQDYEIDESNPEEVDAVKKIEAEKAKFLLNNSYENEDTQYYINYNYDIVTNQYTKLALKQQLAYARDELDTDSVYNSVTGGINRNDLFTIEEKPIKDSDATELVFTGVNTGKQLMRLETIVWHKGQMIARVPYFFVVVVDSWYDEENPVAITSQEDLERYADPNRQDAKAEDYILMNDIVLENYTPLSTQMFNSLDGNGYTIHLNSFATPNIESRNFSLALFSEVTENTTLKNISVNIYQGGQLKVNVARNTGYLTVNVAGFALVNNGIIYNCEVVAYKTDKQTVTVANPGLNVVYTNGANDTEIQLTEGMGIEDSVVAGFVMENNLSIVNCRVGGESSMRVVNVAGVDYLETITLGKFTVKGQVRVAGFVADNNADISASFADNVEIYNMMDSSTAETAGFVLNNTANIEESYVEGAGGGRDTKTREVIIPHRETKINVHGGYVAGFVYNNSGVVKNSYSNIAIENTSYRASYVAGFVYRNNQGATVTLCFTASEIENIDAQQRPFSGVSGDISLNSGTISFSYYYNNSSDALSDESVYTSGITPISDLTVDPENLMYGFSFNSGNGMTNGIWEKTDLGIVLVNPNKTAFSNRYMFIANEEEQFIYNSSLRDISTMLPIDLSYGSEMNPIIIRSAHDFVLAMGRAQSKEISSYLQYYSQTEVWGNYRLVSDIEFDDTIEQNPQTVEQVEGRYNLTTTSKTFKGTLIGNGFTISGIRLSNSQEVENFGFFAKLDTADIVNVNLEVEYVNSDASIVGIMAGTAIDSNIISVSIVPSGTENEIKVNGENVVGGLVGMVFGESKLQDISISNIYVDSADNENKTVRDNPNQISTLRDLIKLRQSISTRTTHLSYAGAVAGFVDTYKLINNNPVEFETSIRVNNFNVLNIHASGFVNVYGEVAGGLFGYIGDSTKVYDARLTLDADSARSIHPSYITAKNLYAGGLVGENYGGLFAVYASYSQDIQEAIEQGENNYYRGGANVERGQDSIFSYTTEDWGFEDTETKHDDPLAIGGLVGYMGSGYIYVGYSKLNVVARSSRTQAIGGIIGMLSSDGVVHKVESISGAPNVNVVLNDVYASGDVHIEGAEVNQNCSSAGIIGAISDSSQYFPIIVLRNIMAMNYYGVETNKLIGDTTALEGEQTTVTSDKHFMLIGKSYKYSEENQVVNFTKEARINTDIYLVNDDASTYNLKELPLITPSSHNTVGGYADIAIGQAEPQRYIHINPFGFSLNQGDITKFLVAAVHIGESDMQSPDGDLSTPATYFKNYFLERGWEEQYWIHRSNELFPRIELMPRANIVTWDVFNTEEVIAKVKANSGITVVLRGKLNNQPNNNRYADIDLREGANQGSMQITSGVLNELHEAFANFHGILISYYQLNHREDCRLSGDVLVYENNTGKIVGGNPQKGVVDPGLVLDDSFFQSQQTQPELNGGTINGINFYFVPKKNAENQNVIDYTLIKGASNLSGMIFRDNSLVYNKPVNISTSNSTIGLITDSTITNSSFMNTNIVVRNSDNYDITLSGAENIGLLAGSISMEGASDNVTISGIQLSKEASSDDENPLVKLNINGKGETVNFGLYAGVITKNDEKMTFNVGLNQLKNLETTISVDSGKQETKADLYVGGFAGQVTSIDGVTFEQAEDTGEMQGHTIIISKGINVVNCNIKNLYAGGAFGSIESGTVTISGGSSTVFTNNIYMESQSFTAEQAYVGGLIGHSNANVTISSFNSTIGVGSLKESAKPTYKVEEKDNGEIGAYTTFDKFYFDHTKVLSPFVVTSGDFGGMIGKAESSTTIGGSSSVTGTIDVAISGSSNFGGYIGNAAGTVDVRPNEVTNDLNTSVYENDETKDATANIGGIVGQFSSGTGDGATNTITVNPSGFVNYTGIVLAAVKNINFGGAVGYMNKQKGQNSFTNVAFGGSLEVWDNTPEDLNKGTIIAGEVKAGGVVGAYNAEADGIGQDTIQGARTYGDVFVNYNIAKEQSNTYNKLKTYYFGGIVGDANNVKILDCSTIMTSFNNRLSTGESVDSFNGMNYEVNAIVGAKGDKVTFGDGNNGKPNYYSSGVTMAYQADANNIDCYYGDQDTEDKYQGYTIETTQSTTAASGTTKNILKDFTRFTNSSKLAPNKLNVGNKFSIGIADNNIEFTKKIGMTPLESYHNITWVYVDKDLGADEPISSIGDNITNIVIVGNGHTVTVSDNRSVGVTDTTNQYMGTLVDSMGSFYTDNKGDVSKGDQGDEEGAIRVFKSQIPNFTAITGMILNLQVESVDMNGNDCSPSYGGVTGVTDGNAFIYGVGVTGKLSVGGEGSHLQLGGIVGTMDFGMINECFVDADISYRAAPNAAKKEDGTALTGALSGVASVGQYKTTIKNTYSSGMLETFVNVDIYTLAHRINEDASGSDLIDDYSISQIKVTDLLGTSSTPQIHFLNQSDKNTFGLIVNGTAEVGEGYTPEEKEAYTAVKEIALSYSNTDGIGKKQSFYVTSSGDDTQTPWYFSPYVNYGYASHGFGYLKNVTTYTYDKIGESVDGQEDEYQYNQLRYEEILKAGKDQYGQAVNQKDWYLGVPNVGKFEQMVATVKNDEENKKYEKSYKFRLRYGFDMSKKSSSFAFGQDIGKDGYSFVLDGDGNSLDFAAAGTLGTPLFGTVTGEIKNLRLADISTSGNDGIATLAKTVNGNLSNIVAIGSVNSGAGVVGGVVATLKGNADKIQSLVNITKTSGGIVGGIVGVLDSGTISNSSNSGQVVSTGNAKNGENIEIKDPIDNIALNFAEVTSAGAQNGSEGKALGNIAGGVVGYAKGGIVKDSYNANSVLSGFTEEAAGNYLAGGVVGYAKDTTINSSYNTGLVGAGNYNSSATYAIAGGIFGYGSPSLDGCINDGAVQAINKIDPSDYTISFTKTGGDETITDFTANPSDLVYGVTMTYNAGEDRRVYAFGLGYSFGTSNDNIKNSQSSTDNIKNDGIIGQVKDQVRDMTFDRDTWMDNNYVDDSNPGDYVATFAVQNGSNNGEYGNKDKESKFHINGLDNYGFPARIYLTDTMTRKLSDENAKAFYSNVAVPNVDIGVAAKGFPRINKITMSRSSDGSGKLNRNNGANNNFVEGKSGAPSSSIYNFSADTNFYASTRFVEYDSYLRYDNSLSDLDSNNVNRITFKGDNGYLYTRSDDDNSIENKIKDIDTGYEKSDRRDVRNMTVNGQGVAIIENARNLETIYVPAQAEISPIEINLGEDAKDITKEDVTVYVTSEGSPITPAFVDKILTPKGAGNYTFSAIIWFDKVYSSCNYNIEVKYDTKTAEIKLRHNTITLDDNKLYIDLTEYMDTLIRNGFVEEIDKTEKFGLTLIGKNGEISREKGDGGFSIDENHILSITLKEGEDKQALLGNGRENIDLKLQFTVEVVKSYDGAVNDLQITSVQGKNSTKQFDAFPTPDYETLTFIEKAEEFNFSSINIERKDIKDEDENTTGYSYDLSTLKNDSYGKLAFGDDNYNFHYTGEWKCAKKPEDDGLTFAFDGDFLNVTGSQDDIDAFDEAFKVFTGFKRTERDVKAKDNDGKELLDDIFAPNNSPEPQTVELDNLGRIDLKFNLNKTDWNTRSISAQIIENAVPGDGLTKTSIEHFGIYFYTVKVNFSYSFNSAKLYFYTTDNLNKGYNLKIGNNFIRQGVVTDQEIDVAGAYQAGATIDLTVNNVSYNKPFALRELNALNLQYNQNGSTDQTSISYTIEKVEYNGDEVDYTDGEHAVQNVCPICGRGTFTEPHRAIQTSKFKTKNDEISRKNEVTSYVYTIFECGGIEVQYSYTIVDAQDEDDQGTSVSIIYRYYPNGGEFGETQYGPGTILQIDGDSVEEKHDLSIFDGIIGWSGQTINVDFIASDFGDKTSSSEGLEKVYDGYISVVKSSINTSKYQFMGFVENFQQYTYTPSCNVYFGYDESATFEADENKTLHYQDSGVYEYEKTQENKTFDLKDTEYEKYPFDVRKISYYYTIIKNIGSGDLNITKNNDVKATSHLMLLAEEDVESSASFDIILLDSDISVTKALGSNTKILIGEDYVIRFFKDASLFSDNQKEIKNTNFVGQISLQNTNSSKTLLTPTSSASIDAKLYGNMRNVNATPGDDVVVSSAVEKTGEAEVKIQSFVAMTGLDASTSTQAVQVILKEQSSAPDGGVVVAGSALKAENGVDADGQNNENKGQNTSNEAGFNGQAGSPGQKGGSVVVSNTILARVGTGGMSGYGGNGANGLFTNSSAYGGGAGGMTHAKGSNGSGGTTPSNVLTGINQFGGNGGVGGLGRFYIGNSERGDICGSNNTVYLSGNGGTSGALEKSGDKGSSGRNIGVNGYKYRLGAGSGFSALGYNNKMVYWPNIKNQSAFDDKYKAWVDSEGLGNVDPVIYAGKEGEIVTENSTQQKSTTVYVSAALNVKRIFYNLSLYFSIMGFPVFIYIEYDMYPEFSENNVNVWCSGEVINGGGQCQFSSNVVTGG